MIGVSTQPVNQYREWKRKESKISHCGTFGTLGSPCKDRIAEAECYKQLEQVHLAPCERAAILPAASLLHLVARQRSSAACICDGKSAAPDQIT